MDQHSQVIIVSAFGRGHWLAVELARRGIQVELLEISEQLGAWAPEDWEGPFGWFSSDKWLESQKEALQVEAAPLHHPHGYVLWLQSGPLEMKGPTLSTRLQALGCSEDVKNFIYEYESLSLGEKHKQRDAIDRQAFQQKWLLGMAQQISSTLFYPNVQACRRGRPLSLFAPFYHRHATRPGFEKSLQWLRDNQVKVTTQVSLQDFAWKDRRNMVGVEMKSPSFAGYKKADRFVLCLSSEELESLHEKLRVSFFPQRKLESMWSWVRFRWKFKDHPVLNSLPSYFVMVQDVENIWSHDNLVISLETPLKNIRDAWVRIPSQQRFHRQYLQEVGENICRQLKSRIPSLDVMIQDYPQEYHYTFTQLGPSRNPVYDPEQHRALYRRHVMNVDFHSPEVWSHLGWDGQMEYQQWLSEKIWHAWQIQQEKLRKLNKSKDAEALP